MTHPVSKEERGAFFYFDFLRWLAASLVVINHWRDLSFLTAAETGPLGAGWQLVYFGTGFGKEAVAVFFVLSGFWITSAVERRIERKHFWATYLIDRLSRLLIVVVPALLIGGLLDWIGRFGLDAAVHRGVSGAITVPEDIAGHLGIVPLLGNLAFLQTILVPTFGTNGPLWSLANELWYYIWFPALLVVFRMRRASFALVSLGIAALAPHLLPGFVVWLTGSLLYYHDRSAFSRGRVLSPWLLVPAGLAALAGMSVSRLGLVPKEVGMMAVGVTFGLFSWVLLRSNPKPLRAAVGLARYGADASFSLYVTHFPLLALIAAGVLGSQRHLPSPVWLAVLVAGYLVAVAYAWLFSRATEKRTPLLRRALRDRLLGPPAPPAPPAPTRGTATP